MNENIAAFVVLFVVAGVSALLVIALLQKSLRLLLEDVVKLPACTTFYSRVLSVGLVFIALSGALGVKFDLKKDAAFMEYVWKVANGLSATFGNTCLFLLGFLIVVTILVAVLRRRSE